MSAITGAPIWVWPLLAFIVWYGIRVSNTRAVPVIAIYLTPLVGLLSINSVAGLPPSPVAWPAYVVAFVCGIAAGHRLQGKWIISKEDGKVTLSGEWLTLTVMLVIFCMNFVGGVSAAMFPATYESVAFIGLFAIFAGLASGSFCGRALKVWRT
jgi:hypothetical protein